MTLLGTPFALICFFILLLVYSPSSAIQYNGKYPSYYSTLAEKLSDSVAFGNCSIPIVPRVEQWQNVRAFDQYPIVAYEIGSDSELGNVWNFSGPKDFQIFHAFSSSFCELKGMIEFYSTGRSPLCTHFSAKKHKLIMHYLNPNHPRCRGVHGEHLNHYCSTSAENAIIRWADHKRDIVTREPFLIEASDVLVSLNGMITTTCGLIGLFDSCGARVPAVDLTDVYKAACVPRSSSCEVPHMTDPLFLISQLDDTQIGQFWLESLPRLVMHYEMLKRHSEIKIHYGFSKMHLKFRSSSEFLKRLKSLNSMRVLKWLGLEHRVVTGDYTADRVYLPREGACQDPLYNAKELIDMRSKLLKLAWKEDDDCSKALKSSNISIGPDERIVLIVHRSLSRSYSQNLFDRSRKWSPEDLQAVIGAVQSALPSSKKQLRVVVYSDQDRNIMECIPCQIRLFSVASVVVGMHGAGLVHTLFMPPGGDVIEVITALNVDKRHYPLIGVFPRLSVISKLNHYTLLIPLKEAQAQIKNNQQYLSSKIRSFYEDMGRQMFIVRE